MQLVGFLLISQILRNIFFSLQYTIKGDCGIFYKLENKNKKTKKLKIRKLFTPGLPS